ncbi:MAG: xanthine dehydrogenase family protein molybdopterin-binding subunit [Dehalococcoidia bacterium]|nr:xanthine dehydrogenase family protein molybdopterin-binding subunit [Dehalococcoidia bacterium]
MLSQVDYDVVGTRPVRPDGVDKVTGRAQYGADIRLMGLLHGTVVRSPHAHARIKSIDTSAAEAHPGVRAVVTGKDLPQDGSPEVQVPGWRYNRYKSSNILAGDKVLYEGHAVAAVAAIDPNTAEEAAALIKVEYEELPPVMTVRQAMEPDAPLLHDDLFTDELGETADKPSNVAQHFRFEMGDLAKGFAEADLIVEREFETASVHQGYIEPHSATALWNMDGRLNVWCCTQGPFSVRDDLSQLLALPVSHIKVTPMEIGGGFGGKIPVYLEPLAALLSKKSGAPVKLTMTRADVFQSSGPAPGSWMKIKVGVTKDGKVTACQASIAMEGGGYPGASVAPAVNCAFACYDYANGQVDGYDVVVNKAKTAAYRAPGAPQAAFAVETVMDEVCRKLNMDPLEFRLLNASKEGTRRVEGPIFARVGNVEVLEAAKGHDHYNTPLDKGPKDGKYRGRGVASGFWFNIGFQSSCTITVNSDGKVSLIEGSVDIGGTRASIAMQAAEVLGIPYEDVKPTVVDTDSIGYTALTGGSRVAFASGWAAIEAAEDVKRQMVERAAKIWDTSVDEVEYVDGGVSHRSDPELRMTFRELAGQFVEAMSQGGSIIGRASVDPRGAGNAFATHMVDVEVDPDTGKVDVLRYTAVQDAGKAIHPSYVEGQMQGGAVQGIGWALNEEYFFNDRGRMMNSSLLDYRMPTSLDLPMIDTVIVEVANPGHRFGARGVGEVPIVPPMAAVANAIHDAIGVRMDALPMSPGKILEARWKNGG